MPEGGANQLPMVLDAMGGDHGLSATVEGAVRAAREHRVPVLLVGSEGEIDARLRALGGPFPLLTVADAPEVVSMEEHAVAAVRRKSRASIVVACEAVRDGQGAAVVSAGNSGAVVASAIFTLGRIGGVERPAIAIPFPTIEGEPCYLLDAGAVVDPRPRAMLGFARLIHGYLRSVRGIAEPRIGLLSNGEEPGKGSDLAREAYSLLFEAPGINFIGNVEGNALPRGVADGIVTDGFSGNIALKSAEGAALLFQSALRQSLTANWYTKLLALPLRPAFRRAARRLDYREYGGAPLLGVKGAVFIAHGRSDARAIESALLAARTATSVDLVSTLEAEMSTTTGPTAEQ